MPHCGGMEINMSINIKQQVKCPKCGQMSDVTVWQSVTAQDSPDLKEDILKGKLNMFGCPSCGQAALMPNPLLYTDPGKKLMITFAPCSDDAAKAVQFDAIKTASKESGELAGLEDYILRFVTAYNEFMEKILIFDNGLHDKVTELLKLLVLMQDSENMEHRVCMFGKRDGDELEFLVQDKRDGKLYTSRIPMQSYETVKEQLRQSGVKYKSFDWEIINADYAARLLRGVNNNL